MQTMDAQALYGSYRTKLEADRAGLGKVNVLLAGLAGVGKSTLVNAVLGARVAGTGIGRSVTRNITCYDYGDSPIAIYDTRGFEIRDSETTVGAVRDKLLELRRSVEEADQIHIAWICILEQSHRVEPVHTSLLANLAELRIPTVVVITQALGDEHMLDAARRLAVPNSGIVPVMAEPKPYRGRTLPAYGVDVLVERTMHLLPRAQQAAFLAAQNARWDLKEQSARLAVRSAAVRAAASAAIPVPGGHSIALAAIQAELIADINAALGLSVRDLGGEEFFKGFFGLVAAQTVGRGAFGLAMSEALRLIPGLGWVGASVIGGSIAAVLTQVLGLAYIDAIRSFARDRAILPTQEQLLRQITENIASGSSRYAGPIDGDGR